MDRISCDIFICGGGLAGLIAAAAFARAGRSVVLADPAPAREDQRSTAILRPGQALMEEAGIWAPLAPGATPLEALRVIDSTGTPPVARDQRLFTPDDPERGPFGWNLANRATRDAAMAALQSRPGLTLKMGAGLTRMLNRTSEVLVWLSDGTRVAAQLAIAADGRDSPLRQAAGIGVRRTRYGQQAMAFSVTHKVPHGHVSTEIYHQGGAFTLVPLPDRDGAPSSAVVWMQDGPDAARTAALPEAEFDAAATARSTGLLGALHRATPVQRFPVITQAAERLVEGRVALIAETAHVMPPIGAQGLNTGLADIAVLKAAIAGHDDPGAPAALERYRRQRAPDLALRLPIIDLFNRTTRSARPEMQALRLMGLRAVHDLRPLRRVAMQAGLGPSPKAPDDVPPTA